MRLRDKIALITGGNSGIGRATAKLFVSEGARVIITGRDEKSLQETADELHVTALKSDVNDPGARDALFQRIGTDFGRLDVLFANAGIVKASPIAETSQADFEAVLHTNVVGVFFCVQAGLPLMKSGGSIILNGSMAASTGSPGISAYAASKAGIRAMGRTLAGELSPRGIRVNVVVPGIIKTPIWERIPRSPEAAAKSRARMQGMVPLRRLGQPQDVAEAVLFLASDAAAYIQGAELVIDGGVLGAMGAAPSHQAPD